MRAPVDIGRTSSLRAGTGRAAPKTASARRRACPRGVTGVRSRPRRSGLGREGRGLHLGPPCWGRSVAGLVEAFRGLEAR